MSHLRLSPLIERLEGEYIMDEDNIRLSMETVIWRILEFQTTYDEDQEPLARHLSKLINRGYVYIDAYKSLHLKNYESKKWKK